MCKAGKIPSGKNPRLAIRKAKARQRARIINKLSHMIAELGRIGITEEGLTVPEYLGLKSAHKKIETARERLQQRLT